MSFVTPTLNDLVRVAENGLFTSFDIDGGSVLQKSVLKVIARVFAGVCFLLVLLLQKMWKNCFLTTCDVESLKDAGVDFDLPNKPEGYARGIVVVKKIVTTDVTLPQGTVVADDMGVEYEIDADYLLSGAENTSFKLNAIAVQPGSEGNRSTSAKLSFRDGTPEGVADDVYVDDGGLTGGVSIEVLVNGNTELWGETVEEYRARLLRYRRTQPHGGCEADYRSWAERFPSVSKCIVQENYPNTNSVTCVLAFFGDGADSIELNQANLAEVESYLKSKVRRPVTADIRVVSCSEKKVNFSIGVSPNNVNVQASVMSALKTVLRSYEPGNVVYASSLGSELKGVANVDTVTVCSVDGGDFVQLSKADHELPVIGSVSWLDV